MLKILAGIVLIMLYLLSPVIYLLIWISSLGMKLLGGVFCLIAVITYFEDVDTIGNILFLLLIGLILIGISPFLSFVGVFCEEVQEKLFTYITGNPDF